MKFDGIDTRPHDIDAAKQYRSMALGLTVAAFVVAAIGIIGPQWESGPMPLWLAVSGVAVAPVLLFFAWWRWRQARVAFGAVPAVRAVIFRGSVWLLHVGAAGVHARRIARDGSHPLAVQEEPRTGAAFWSLRVGDSSQWRIDVGGVVVTHRDVRRIRDDVARVNGFLGAVPRRIDSAASDEQNDELLSDGEHRLVELLERVLEGDVATLADLVVVDDAMITAAGDRSPEVLVVSARAVRRVLGAALSGTVDLLDAAGWAWFVNYGRLARPVDDASQVGDDSLVIVHEPGQSDQILEGLSLMQVFDWEPGDPDPLDGVRRAEIEEFLDRFEDEPATTARSVDLAESRHVARGILGADPALGYAARALDDADGAFLIADPQAEGLGSAAEFEAMSAVETDAALASLLGDWAAEGPLTVVADHGVPREGVPEGRGIAFTRDRMLLWSRVYRSGSGVEVLSHSATVMPLRVGLVISGMPRDLGLEPRVTLGPGDMERLAARAVAVVVPVYDGESYLVIRTSASLGAHGGGRA